jgi:23S rRNA (pseudouridine1915-N3)-methyltransferase
VKLRLIAVGKGAPAWADEAVADYGQRLRRFGGLDETVVRPEPFRGDVEAVRAAEAERLLALVKDRDRLVALDERGEAPGTEAFAGLLREGLTAQGALVFAIGGPYGHGEALRRRAWRTVRLSSLVLNHQVARVVLVEQLYRAFTVLAGEPYHH